MQDGFGALFGALLDRYPGSAEFQALAAVYAPQQAPNPEPQIRSFVYVRLTEEESRQKALQLFRDGGFGARLMASTNFTSLYALSDATVADIESLMADTDLEYTAFDADGPAYLLPSLLVQGPDGRSFRFTDTPAATRVADIAADVLQEYPDGGRRMTVTDRVQPDGQGVRLDADQTLHDAGVRDGDRLRVGYQTNAGAVNPSMRDDALVRAGNEIRAFALHHPRIGVTADAPERAAMYELEFDQPSFGPPPATGGEPVPLNHHVVQIELGPDFPVLAPQVFWITEIFHPNVYPNYDCEAARSRPAFRGLVCLGELAEAYQPALDFGRLCQTLLDIAGYRNYSVLEPTGRVVVRNGRPVEDYAGNTYNVKAGLWALTHQDVIGSIGGMRIASLGQTRPRFRSLVEPYTP